MVNCSVIWAVVQALQATNEDAVGTILPVFVSSLHALVGSDPAAVVAAADDDDDTETAATS